MDISPTTAASPAATDERGGWFCPTFDLQQGAALRHQIPTGIARDYPVLAEHYRFTYKELDLAVNYDIKYRMGREG